MPVAMMASVVMVCSRCGASSRSMYTLPTFSSSDSYTPECTQQSSSSGSSSGSSSLAYAAAMGALVTQLVYIQGGLLRHSRAVH